MKRPDPTARTLRRQERAVTRNFLLLLLLIVGVVAVIQVLLFLTLTHVGTESATFLEHVRHAPALLSGASASV
jgi:hypothetical protein